jgi:polar amino acid transport system substrate-binding protein
LQAGKVLVRNEFSVISAGTEGMKVEQAKMNMLEKAKARPDHVKKVLGNVKKEGLVNTYKKVMGKLDSLTPLGYSCAGTVVAVSNDVKGFSVGDIVACAGDSANHAEMISVYANLCAKVPENVEAKYAAFSTIGAIALQGIRQADVRLGENVAVIGLGLIGQLTVQMLKASGCRVVGADLDQGKVEKAKKAGADTAVLSSNLKSEALSMTNGYGVDAVIITAATSSLEPIEVSGDILRKKGRVVIVGAVPTGFSREKYYKKELELRMSASYGPGRYDNTYEEKGIDYPYGYVRWTEKRNMDAFLELIKEDKLDLSKIITHEYKFDKADDAYKMLNEKTEDYMGIVLEYDKGNAISKNVEMKPRIDASLSKINVGMIGAGSFAQNYILPHLSKNENVDLNSVVTGSGLSAKDAAIKFDFQNAVSEPADIFNDNDINCIFIATRHNTHAGYVADALEKGKNVFVEKPLAMNNEELERIINRYNSSPESKLMVGFNRRFADMSKKVKKYFASVSEPIFVSARVNAGKIPADSWIQDPEVGGGRIIGEACHFIDLAKFWIDEPVEEIYSSKLDLNVGAATPDCVNICVKYKGGSMANIQYLANGSGLVPKERYEIFGGGRTAVLDDFKVLLLSDNKKAQKFKGTQDKGHKDEIKTVVDVLANGKEMPISAEDIFETTRVTFSVMDSLKNKEKVNL